LRLPKWSPTCISADTFIAGGVTAIVIVAVIPMNMATGSMRGSTRVSDIITDAISLATVATVAIGQH
jgi:hypothetical protein